MNTLFTLVIVIQVISALVIIGLVLLQHGKGADMGAAFGSGASGSLFGASGSSNFLSKSTGVAAAIFFCATLALAYIGGSRGAVGGGGVMERLAPVAAPAPAPKAAPETGKSESATGAANTAPAGNAGQANEIPK